MDLSDLMKMIKDPQAMERLAKEAQSMVSSVTAVGSAGGGMVRITMNGAMDLIAVDIDPEAVDPSDVGILQDLIKAAHADAIVRVREALQTRLPGTMGSAGSFPGGFGGLGS